MQVLRHKLKDLKTVGSECCKEVRDNPHIHQRLLDPLVIPKVFNVFFLFRMLYKVFAQFFLLLWMLLFTIPKPGFPTFNSH